VEAGEKRAAELLGKLWHDRHYGYTDSQYRSSESHSVFHRRLLEVG
jgi:hypothetical protein